MPKILTYNNISPVGLARLPASDYSVGPDITDPDAILLRSFDLHTAPIADSVKAVARAGAGVNNIPVADLTQRGIPVFNAPGANANAVTELVIAGMLLAARNLFAGWDFTRGLQGDDEALHHQIEKGKKHFAGFELAGKTIGVIGLGAIGVKVANAASGLGLKVIGYDPQLTVDNARHLSRSVQHTTHLDDALNQADFITLHIPLNDQTRHFVNAERIAGLKPGVILLNFSRGGIADNHAIATALDAGQLKAYVTDFPSKALLNQNGAIVLPHLGASTAEAEDNCAAMVAEQLRDFLETGSILHAVNFPNVSLPALSGKESRLAIANENVPNMVSQITAALGDSSLNILDLVNKSRGDYAYTLIDVQGHVPEATLSRIRSIPGVLSTRLIT